MVEYNRRMKREEDSPPALTDEEKRGLLGLARHAIATRLGLSAPAPTEEMPDMAAGAFVTLHKKGELRGCIGLIETEEPLGEVVRRMAVEAAFGDRRFNPLTRDEFSAVDIEISVMTPPRPVGGFEEIDIPRHGIVMACEGRKGIFLPQVAAERGWGREKTLDQLAMKIGLYPGAWRDNATFSVFEALVFGE